MAQEEEIVVRLTREQAWELFSRCIASEEPDTPASKDALRRLADRLKKTYPSKLRLVG